MKPRIIKGWGEEWWCIPWPSDDSFMGIGPTVQDAYLNWKVKNNK